MMLFQIEFSIHSMIIFYKNSLFINFLSFKNFFFYFFTFQI